MPAQVVSLAGRDGFGGNANVYGFDFSGGTTSSTCRPRNHNLISLAGRQGFGRDANVYGFDFSGGTTSTYVPANHVYRRPIATPEAHVQSPASKPKREKWTTRLKNFHRRLWTERHQQSESQKRRAAKLERHFGDHMLEYLIGCGAG